MFCPDLRDEMVISFFLKHEVHVSWSIAVPLEHLEQLADRSIGRYRVRNRHDGFEPEDSCLVATHHGPLVGALAIGILHIIEAFAICLPDIDLDIGYRTTRCILDRAQHQARLAGRVMRDQGAIRGSLGFV